MARDLAADIKELKALYGEVHSAVEGVNTFYLLKSVRLPPGCTPAVSDVLLCADARDGYPFRLFFAQRIQTRAGLNWNGSAYILDRTWHAFSWQLPDEGLSLAQKVSTLMRPLE